MSERPFQPKREDVRPEELEAYDRVIRRQNDYGYGRPAGQEAGPHYGALLQAPLVADHLSEMGVYFRSRGEAPGSFSHVHREWTDMVIGKEMSPVVLWGHMLDAVASGVRPEAIAALVEGREEDLDDEERQFAEFIRHVIRGTMTQEAHDAMEARLGVRGVVDYIAWIGFLLLTVRLISALSPGSSDGMDELVRERLRSVLDGTAELPEGPRIPASAPS
jgi:hypothetical protein